LRRRPVVGMDRDPESLCQQFPAMDIGIADGEVLGDSHALAQETCQQRLGHIAAADERDSCPRQHGAIIRTALRQAQLATAGRGCIEWRQGS